MSPDVKNFDEYFLLFDGKVKEKLLQLREVISKTVPEASEVISYKMPAYKVHGKMLVYFAGYKNHIGFYPGAAPIAAFQKEIAKYKNAKGSVQFPLDKPIPLELVITLTKYRLKEILVKIKK